MEDSIFSSQDLDKYNNADLVKSINKGELIGIVSEIDGGIIAYAIGLDHTRLIVEALNSVVCKDNTVIVSPVKDSWTREEHENGCLKAMTHGFHVGNTLVIQNIDIIHKQYPHRHPSFWTDKTKQYCSFDKWLKQNID